jgi:hypothetical protein
MEMIDSTTMLAPSRAYGTPLDLGDEEIRDRRHAQLAQGGERRAVGRLEQEHVAAHELALVEGPERARRLGALGRRDELDEALADGLHRQVEHDPAAVDEQEVG